MLDLLLKELKGTSFSFVSYNIKAFNTILKLSVLHPYSTFLHLVNENLDLAEKLHLEAKSANRTNIAVGSVKLDSSFTSKLMSCPDFFRYQYIGTCDCCILPLLSDFSHFQLP